MTLAKGQEGCPQICINQHGGNIVTRFNGSKVLHGNAKRINGAAGAGKCK